MGNRDMFAALPRTWCSSNGFVIAGNPSRGLGPTEIACSYLGASRHRGVVKSLGGFYCGPAKNHKCFFFEPLAGRSYRARASALRSA
jgi:hypothetical protein